MPSKVSNIKDKACLIGNGINNINTLYTWSDLINDLIEYIGACGQITLTNKPFPLLYEEIIIEAVKNRNLQENQIKKFIAEKVNKLKSNEIHKEIINLGIKNILTTNYDLTLEGLITDQTQLLKNEGSVKENTYSIFRHYQIKDTTIWHIHGDRNYPASITLGYEHYSGYLQQMRNYVVSGTGNSYKNLKLSPLIKRMKQGKTHKNYSWLDFFFKSDLYIIGLTMDFIEIHLWWLLTFRQRAVLTKKINIQNKIFYFYPDNLTESIQHKIQLLTSYGVIPVSCPACNKNEADYYFNVIEKIKNHI